MTTATLETPVNVKPAEDPFHIGYRLRTFTDANGELVSEPVPLTEEDFLHPQEEDRFMLVDPHQRALHYLVHALRISYRNLPEVRVFTDHRIDWQVPGILPHGPDAVLFDRFTADWNGEGTLPVRDTNSRVLAVFEVTSESTRKIDLGKKFVEYATRNVKSRVTKIVPTLITIKLFGRELTHGAALFYSIWTNQPILVPLVRPNRFQFNILLVIY